MCSSDLGLSEDIFNDVFEGVPQGIISKNEVDSGVSVIDLLAGKTGFLNSGGEARRALKENSISINKEKVNDQFELKTEHLLNNKYALLQRGKKNYFVVKVE